MKEIGHTRLKYKGEIVDVAVNDNAEWKKDETSR